MKIVRESDKTVIDCNGSASAADMHCTIEFSGEGNSAKHFLLKVSGGQMEGQIEMHGEWERDECIEFFEQVLIELRHGE